MMLGNLSIDKIEKRLGVQFPDELVKFMKESHQDNANDIGEGKWHCFDLPFVLVVGDMEIATKIHEYLKPLEKNMQTSMKISINKANGRNLDEKHP